LLENQRKRRRRGEAEELGDFQIDLSTNQVGYAAEISAGIAEVR
jgi:hypothetical protein